jgi:c-di-GMP-binding flagellar brake protein YcgR
LKQRSTVVIFRIGRRWVLIDTYEDRNNNGRTDRERRTKRRFQIDQEVRYKMLYGQRIAETGTGRTFNISSGGVWFTTENMLTSGMPVELSMTWPVLLNDSCPMKLMIYGCVVRSNEKGAAVAIERYEFRTSGAKSFSQNALGSSSEMRLTS